MRIYGINTGIWSVYDKNKLPNTTNNNTESMEKETKNPVLDSFTKFVERTAPEFLMIEPEIFKAEINGEVIQGQLATFLNDAQSHIAIVAEFNEDITVTTSLDTLVFRGDGVGYLKNPAAGPSAFHLLNLGNLAQTSLSAILGPVFAQLDALRRQVAAGDAAKVILGSQAKISSFETQIVSKENQASPEELFKFHRAVLEMGGGLKAKITKELDKRILLPEDTFEGVGTTEGFKNFTDIVAYIHNTANILTNQKGVNIDSENAYADLIGKLAGQIENKTGQANPADNLESTDTEVLELQKRLLGVKDQLIQGQNKARQLLTSVSEAKKQADAQLQVIKKEQKEWKGRATGAQEIQQTLQQKVAEIQPLIETAQREGAGISPNDLNEIKHFSKPPKTVVMVLEALFLLLKRRKLSWKGIKTQLGNPREMMEKVFRYDPSNISEKLKNKLNKDYFNAPEWDVKAFKKTSKAIASLGAWIETQMKIHGLMEAIAPLKQVLKETQAESGSAPQELEAVKKQLESAQKIIATQQRAYEASQEEIQNLRAQVDEIRRQITEKVKAAGGEVPNQEQAAVNAETAVGDSLLDAAIQTYLGGLDNLSKNLLIDNWKRLLEKEGLKFDKEASVTGDLNGQAIQFNVKQDVLDTLLNAPAQA